MSDDRAKNNDDDPLKPTETSENPSEMNGEFQIAGGFIGPLHPMLPHPWGTNEHRLKRIGEGYTNPRLEKQADEMLKLYFPQQFGKLEQEDTQQTEQTTKTAQRNFDFNNPFA